MAKKTPQNGNVAVLPALTGDQVQFAVRLGVELSGTVEERADMAAAHMSRSQRHMLASGILLGSIKAECDHGQFTDLITERGFEERAARRAMQYAQFILARPEAERLQLLELAPSKVIAFANVDSEIVEASLQEGVERIDALSVRALQQELADAKASLADVAVQRDTAVAELEGAKKRLAKGAPAREDSIPFAIADLRAEIVALTKKAELAVDGLAGVGDDIMVLPAEAAGWADASLRLAVAALGSLQLQIDGVLSRFKTGLPDTAPVPKSYLTAREIREAAQVYQQLVATHGHEKALRDWEAQQARPRGKGRPAAKPEAPKGA